MICAVCKHAVAEIGLLCNDCSEEVTTADVAPEQIEDHVEAPTDAGFVDMWGRPHRLEATTVVGRNIGSSGLAIFESSVSRQHARIELDSDGCWWLRDLASANGTFVDDRRVEGSSAIADGERVRFGEIAFHFLRDVASLPPPRFPSTIGKTMSVPQPRALTQPIIQMSRDVCLRHLAVKLHEPTGGGGGVVEIEGRRVQLTLPQFELVSLLVARMIQEAGLAEDARGFVKPTELMMKLSWDSQEPNDDHVRQLVRRVRRLLRKAHLDELIESRPRTGYRLRVIPA